MSWPGASPRWRAPPAWASPAFSTLCTKSSRGRWGQWARLKRGRHTTREVALLQLPGAGWVADTPGFSTLRLQPLTRDEVAHAYPDYQMVADECRFKGCLHREEPGCAVRQRVQAGEFDAGRHRRYLVFLDEAEESEPWQAGGPAR